MTAAKAAAMSGLSPLSSWIATLERVAIMVRMPSAVVFIFFVGLLNSESRTLKAQYAPEFKLFFRELPQQSA